jgi:PTS system nitrogen regulatory IIA component
MEQGVAGSPSPLLIRSLLCEETIEPALSGRTAQGVLRSLVEVANRTWKVYDPARVMDAVRERESLGSTALPGGVAIPHPKRRLTAELEESSLAFGRTSTGIPLGNDGTLTDLFFLILCVDDQTHLQTIARLSRMFQREDFLPRIRACDDPQACLELIEEVESATYG